MHFLEKQLKLQQNIEMLRIDTVEQEKDNSIHCNPTKRKIKCGRKRILMNQIENTPIFQTFASTNPSSFLKMQQNHICLQQSQLSPKTLTPFAPVSSTRAARQVEEKNGNLHVDMTNLDEWNYQLRRGKGLEDEIKKNDKKIEEMEEKYRQLLEKVAIAEQLSDSKNSCETSTQRSRSNSTHEQSRQQIRSKLLQIRKRLRSVHIPYRPRHSRQLTIDLSSF